MKDNVKNLMLCLLVILLTFGGGKACKYLYTKYTTSKQIEESTKRKYEDEKKAKELDKALKKIEDTIQEQIDFMENLCFAFWQENKIPSDIAVTLCGCEKEMYANTMPSGDIWFIMENIERFGFLLYKKDKKATEIEDKLKNIRKKCIDKERNKIGLILRKNNH